MFIKIDESSLEEGHVCGKGTQCCPASFATSRPGYNSTLLRRGRRVVGCVHARPLAHHHDPHSEWTNLDLPRTFLFCGTLYVVFFAIPIPSEVYGHMATKVRAMKAAGEPVSLVSADVPSFPSIYSMLS